MHTLATDEIGKSYRGRRVVNGVSLQVLQGEVVGLLGPNGAGKTTSFYAIVGLIPPDTGRVLYDDEDITSVPMYLRAREYGISYLPQEASVFRKLTVEENILAVLEVQPISWHERKTAGMRCRGARGGGLRLRARCASTRRSFCSMSRFRGSTRLPFSIYRRSFRICAPAGLEF